MNPKVCGNPLLDYRPGNMEGVRRLSFCSTACCIPCPPQRISCPLFSTLIEPRNPHPTVRENSYGGEYP